MKNKLLLTALVTSLLITACVKKEDEEHGPKATVKNIVPEEQELRDLERQHREQNEGIALEPTEKEKPIYHMPRENSQDAYYDAIDEDNREIYREEAPRVISDDVNSNNAAIQPRQEPKQVARPQQNNEAKNPPKQAVKLQNNERKVEKTQNNTEKSEKSSTRTKSLQPKQTAQPKVETNQEKKLEPVKQENKSEKQSVDDAIQQAIDAATPNP